MAGRVVLVQRVRQFFARLNQCLLQLRLLQLELVKAVGGLLQNLRNLGAQTGCCGFGGIHINKVRLFERLAGEWALRRRLQVLQNQRLLEHVTTNKLSEYFL